MKAKQKCDKHLFGDFGAVKKLKIKKKKTAKKMKLKKKNLKLIVIASN